MTSTRERLLDAGERIVLEKGFHAMTIDEVVTAAEAARGSLYNAFESKEGLGLALIRLGVEREISHAKKFLENASFSPLERLTVFWNDSIGTTSAAAGKHGSLLVKLSSEVSTLSPEMRAAMAQGFDEMRGLFQRAIAQGQADGTMSQSLDSAATADLVCDAWNGAILRAGIVRSAAPLQQVAQALRIVLTPVQEASAKRAAAGVRRGR